MSTPASPLPVFLTTEETAKMLRLSDRTLEGMRLDGSGPPYIKLGPSRRAKVVYRLSDIETWLTEHRKR